MHHRIAGKKLNRSTKHRKSLIKNLTAALIMHGKITTTEVKAKIMKNRIDKLITQAKKGNLHSRRLIHAYFNQDKITNRLVDHLAPNMSTRVSGYTKITKLGYRRGDNSSLAQIEFVDHIAEPEIIKKPSKVLAKPKTVKPKTTTKPVSAKS